MSSTFTIWKEKREERKKVADQAGLILTTAHKDNKRALKPEELTEWENRMKDVDALEQVCKTYERQHIAEQSLAAMPNDPRRAGEEDIVNRDAGGITKKQRDQWDSLTFRSWCSGGPSKMNNEQRGEYLAMQAQLAQHESAEVRALSDVTGAVGAYTVPQGFVYNLETALKYFGGIIDACEYIDTTMGNFLPWPSINDTPNTGETISENTQVMGSSGGAGEQDPAYGVINFSAYMSDSGFVLVPLQLMQDSAFDIETYLVGLLKIRIGRRMNNVCTVGNGSGQATGVVTASTLGKQGASPTTISYSELLDLEYSVDRAYRDKRNPKCGFMFNDLTEKAIKKLTDNNGRPLWLAGGVSQGIQGPNPDRLDDFPYWVNNDVAAMASSAKSALFGDFSKYKIRRVREMMMVRAGERFIDKLQIGFLAWLRFDGNLVDAGTHPITYFQNSAT